MKVCTLPGTECTVTGVVKKMPTTMPELKSSPQNMKWPKQISNKAEVGADYYESSG
jgi:hypothetical protein